LVRRSRSASPLRWRALVAATAVLVAAGPGTGRAEEPGTGADPAVAEVPASPPAVDLRPQLTVNLGAHAWITGGLLVATGGSELLASKLAPPRCRWCEPPQLDRWARNQLMWKDLKAAGLVSNALMISLPVGALLGVVLTARADGAGARQIGEDVVVLAEGVALATTLMQVAKFSTGRLRPQAWASGGGVSAGSRMSFWAGHSSSAFSMAAGATQVARLRGRPGWKWIALATFTGAAAVSWARLASDRHWLTDVLAGTAVGTATGLVVPLLAFHRADGRGPPVTLVPAPGGLALHF
jgi:membrane-associated phospholipid phosphatase